MTVHLERGGPRLIGGFARVAERHLRVAEREEPRRLHPRGREYVLPDVTLVRHAADLRDDLAEDDVTSVAVFGLLAGLERQRPRRDERVVIVVRLEAILRRSRERLAEEVRDA